MWTDPGNIFIAHRHINVKIVTEAAQFPEKEHELDFRCMAIVFRNWQNENPQNFCQNPVKSWMLQRQVRIDLSTLLSNKDWEDVRRSLYNKPTFTENCIKRTIINFCQEGSLGNIIRTIQIYTINKSLLLSLRPSVKTVSITLTQVNCISS